MNRIGRFDPNNDTNVTRVLIVSNIDEERNILTDIIGSIGQGIEIVKTKSSRNAIRLASHAALVEKPFKLIVIDADTSQEEDGSNALESLTKIYPKPNIIVLSSMTSQGTIASLQAINKGANDYIAKPSTIIGYRSNYFKKEISDKVSFWGYVKKSRKNPSSSVQAQMEKKREIRAPDTEKIAAVTENKEMEAAETPLQTEKTLAEPPTEKRKAALKETKVEIAATPMAEKRAACIATGKKEELLNNKSSKRKIPLEHARKKLKKETVAKKPANALEQATAVQHRRNLRKSGHTATARQDKGKNKFAAIAIGCSTGGPQALLQILKDLPQSVHCPIFVTQHMPASFTAVLAEQISRCARRACVEPSDNQLVEEGCIYVAPGDRHLLLVEENREVRIRLDDGVPENYCKPAVDPMLRTLADIYGSKLCTFILTGMGKDGLEGCKKVAQRGGTVIAQDLETSIVWGMPGAVVKDGLANMVLSLSEIRNLLHELQLKK